MITDRMTRRPRTTEEKEVDFRKDKEFMQHYWTCEKGHLVGKDVKECSICLYNGIKYANEKVAKKPLKDEKTDTSLRSEPAKED